MAITLVPCLDPNKSGASDHVLGICNAAQDPSFSQVMVQPYVLVDAVMQPIWQVSANQGYSNNNTSIIVIGDYCTASIASALKNQYGENTKIVASSYTILSNKLIELWLNGCIDCLAVPESELTSSVIAQSPFSLGITEAIQNRRVICTTLVPHTVTPKIIEEKWQEWGNKANINQAILLPQIARDKALVFVVIPGDVEDQDGKAILFTPDHAVKLAAAIYQDAYKKFGSNVQFLVTNGARTSKYNPDLVGDSDFDCHNPKFHNQNRFKSIQSNPVTEAFISRLKDIAGEDNIFSGCMGDRNIPSQGFLAFYYMLNQHAKHGGRSVLYLDGVSVTMTAQALSVMDSQVELIACDTPAKNPSHIASVKNLFTKGYVGLLSLDDPSLNYVYHSRLNSLKGRPSLDDGNVIVQELLKLTTETARVGR